MFLLASLVVFSNVRQKTWEITAGLVFKQAEERYISHHLFG